LETLIFVFIATMRFTKTKEVLIMALAQHGNYGVNETNGLVNGTEYHEQFDYNNAGEVDWTEPGLKVTRLRLLSDPGFPYWDVSYCHGKLSTGENVRVSLPFDQIPKKNITGFIIDQAKKEKVFAKGLGILDCISTLN
jgi:hypothetical protein